MDAVAAPGDPVTVWLQFGQVPGFWMSVYPVTNQQYAHFVAETGHPAPRSFADRRFNDPAQPVVTVSWNDARVFTTWLTSKLGYNVRLPTEAEWEYVARGGGDGRRYPWGNEPPDASRATFGRQRDTGSPAVVGHTPLGKSVFEIHDLAGNVWEWCLDVFGNYLSTETIVDASRFDVLGGKRVVRGGSWLIEHATDLRSACRSWHYPLDRLQFVGIRVVCSADRRAGKLLAFIAG